MDGRIETGRTMLIKGLLICGALASVLYIGIDIVAATLLYPGYDYTSQQVSELSAIGAPSQAFWVALSYPYALLTAAFGAGVWLAAGSRLSLRIAGLLIVLFAVNSLSWVLFAPMHMRATEFTGTDTMHIAFAGSALLLMLVYMTCGAIALGRGFHLYTAATLVAMLAAGAVVGTQVPAIAAGLPTPWMGLVERISVYGPTIWIAVFAVTLVREIRVPEARLAHAADASP